MYVPLADFLESLAPIILTQTLSPQSGASSLVNSIAKNAVMETVIDTALDTTLSPVFHKNIKPSELVYNVALSEYQPHKAYRKEMNRIVRSTKQGYFDNYQDASEFLQGYYQMKATMSALYNASLVQLALIPESEKNFGSALENLAGNAITDQVLSLTIASKLDLPADSEPFCELIQGIFTGTIDMATEDYEQDSIQGYIKTMTAEIKNEKMKLQYALYNDPKDTLSYAIINY